MVRSIEWRGDLMTILQKITFDKKVILLFCFFICFISVAFPQSYRPSFDFNSPVTNGNTLSTQKYFSKESFWDKINIEDTLNQSSVHSLRILKETGAGVFIGGSLSLLGGFIAIRMSNGDGWDRFGNALIGAYAGYTIGSSLGVYWVAKVDKPNLSFPATMMSGIGGAGIGILIFNASNQNGVGGVALIIMPLAFSILYAELVE
jgi:hypothetical protein